MPFLQEQKTVTGAERFTLRGQKQWHNGRENRNSDG